MRVTRVRWWTVRVPFARPFATARGTLPQREGVLVSLETSDGGSGWGEASPWPPFGQGDATAAARAIAAIAPALPGLALADVPGVLDALAHDEPGGAAARAALELAALDALAAAAGTRIADLLGDDVSDPIRVNAVIGAEAPAAAAAAARRAIARGYATIKLKVGGGPVDDDVARTGAVRAAIGAGPRLRLDANGAWTASEALDALARLARFDLELIEQPCAVDDLAGMARVRAAAHAPVAADEAVRDLASARAIVDAGAADVLVVKPVVVGGVRAGAAIAELAATARVETIVTSAIEFGIGIAGALHLAAALPRPVRTCGLATAGWLAHDLTGGVPPVRDGRMALPETPGLGVVPDAAALRRYATAPVATCPA